MTGVQTCALPIYKGHSCKIYTCTEDYFKFFNSKRIGSFFHYAENFIFDTMSLTKLEGKAYKQIRHSLNSVGKSYDVKFREYTDVDYNSAMVCYSTWCSEYADRKKVEKGGKIIDKNKFFKWLKYRGLLGIKIYVAECDNKIIGICGISKLCDNASIIVFERCLNSYVGISDYVWINTLRNFDFYTYEQDGDGGTRKGDGSHMTGLYDYKMKFKPVMLQNLYGVDINKKDEKITNNFFVKREEIGE